MRVCRWDDVPIGRALARLVDPEGTGDARAVCVVRDGGRVQALLDRCPHRDVALSGGVVRDGLLTCPGHFWRFSLADGARTDKPDEVATLYPTRVVDGWVECRLPPRPPRPSLREWLLEQARARPPLG